MGGCFRRSSGSAASISVMAGRLISISIQFIQLIYLILISIYISDSRLTYSISFLCLPKYTLWNVNQFYLILRNISPNSPLASQKIQFVPNKHVNLLWEVFLYVLQEIVQQYWMLMWRFKIFFPRCKWFQHLNCKDFNSPLYSPCS